MTIQRPAEEVFVFLADFENIPMWNYAIEETSKTSADSSRSAPGTARPARSGREYGSFEGSSSEASHRLAMPGQIGPFQATISYELEARAGATRLVDKVELDPSRAMLKLLPARDPQDQGGSGAGTPSANSGWSWKVVGRRENLCRG